MLAAYFLTSRQHEERADGPIMRLYSPFLIWSLRRSFITIAIELALGAALAGATRMPAGFLPPLDTARST